MKHTLNLHAVKFTLATSLFVAACSGGKQQSHDHEMGTKTEMQADSTDEATSEIKVFENVDASVKTQLSGFLSDYFALNKTLIEDNFDGAKVAAKKLGETVGKFDMTGLKGEQMDFYHAQLTKLSTGLKAMDESADIEETRAELAVVSESIYALAKAYQPNTAELYYQFCPMAKNGDGANWLSETKEVANPYMGQRMLKCGMTKEVLAQTK